jgi:hypothetical protein
MSNTNTTKGKSWKETILEYSLILIPCGIIGYAIYNFIIINYICSTTIIESIIEQCKSIDVFGIRFLIMIPFIVGYIILLAFALIREPTNYQKEKPN